MVTVKRFNPHTDTGAMWEFKLGLEDSRNIPPIFPPIFIEDKNVLPVAGFLHLLAWEDDKVVGCTYLKVGSKPTSKWTAEVAVAVAPEMRGRGVGTELLCSIITLAEQEGMRKLWLRVYADNNAAIHLYRRYGFTMEGVFVAQEWENGRPLDLISMAKYLPVTLGP